MTPETELIAKADATQLEAAIAELPLSFRETLVLRDMQGLDYREIAEETRVPVGTVMSRLARARQRLVAVAAPNGSIAEAADQTRKRNREAVPDGRWNAVPISNYRRLNE